MSGPAAFDPEVLLRALAAHRVRFVLIGGFAAVYHGAANLTFDIDIAPESSLENLGRLSEVLVELQAQVRTEGAVLPFAHDATSLGRAALWNLSTPHGDLDITFAPSGTRGYGDLHRDAMRAQVLGIEIEVASLADVIRSKEAADRPKDHLVLPLLRRLLEEQGG